MSKFVYLLCCALIIANVSQAYKILLLSPIPGKSHSILGDGIARILLNAGHEVTYATAYPWKDPPSSLHQIDVSTNKAIFDVENQMDIKAILDKKMNVGDRNTIFGLMTGLSAGTVKNEDMQKVLKDPNQTFDVIIAEWMFSDLYSAIQPIFGCPFIWFSTVEPHWMVLRLIDGYPNPAYVSSFLYHYRQPFTFKERVEGLWHLISWAYSLNTWVNDFEKAAYESHIVPILKDKEIPVPQYEGLRYNSSLILGNSHVSLGSSMRLPQNYKPICGYHIDPITKPLPKDLEEIMNKSEHGVIYFSMGSNLKSKDLPMALKQELLSIFSGLKQTVLWKFEETLPNLPENVHILEWAPQPSILAHPKCILFITHGGLLSTTEAIHFGKPVIGIPVFADQFINVRNAVIKGFGLKVDLSYAMAGDLKVAIGEALANPSLGMKAKELSFIYHDRVASPVAELLHWVHHVVRTGGASHLRSPAVDVPLYQKLYLDLLAVICIVLILAKKIVARVSCTLTFKKKLD